ncbi:MAG TPA: hypothetical protein VF156_08390 [Agromyces sp.]
MSIAIGVTGHRLLADVDRISSGIDEAVGRLATLADGAWTAVSALAEGADRLVARRLLDRPGTRLVAVLPLPPDEYERDFADRGSRTAFRRLLDRAAEVVVVPPQPTREAAYEAAGLGVLERSDILVAVWDGDAARGRGGTGAIVAEARLRAMPLVWVHAGNRAGPDDDPTSFGVDQGAATYERLDAAIPPPSRDPETTRGRRDES